MGISRQARSVASLSVAIGNSAIKFRRIATSVEAIRLRRSACRRRLATSRCQSPGTIANLFEQSVRSRRGLVFEGTS
jgi:hypothetical protein